MSNDPHVLIVFDPGAATATTTASSGVIRPFVPHEVRSDPGHHTEAKLAVPPEPTPSLLPTSHEMHELVTEGVLVASAVAVIIAGRRVHRAVASVLRLAHLRA